MISYEQGGEGGGRQRTQTQGELQTGELRLTESRK